MKKKLGETIGSVQRPAAILAATLALAAAPETAMADSPSPGPQPARQEAKEATHFRSDTVAEIASFAFLGCLAVGTVYVRLNGAEDADR